MSDNIPFEIQEEIIKRLPLISVIRCRSVSKAWKAFIDTKDFITNHTRITKTHPHHHQMLIKYGNLNNYKKKYVSIDDDDDYGFPRHKFIFKNLPIHVKLLLKKPTIVGSSHGLLLLHGNFPKPCFDSYGATKMAVLWNPSIKKAVAIELPMVHHPDETIIGFGVCPQTFDPKLVKITQIQSIRYVKYINKIPSLKIEVFTLSSGAWRNPLISINNLPLKSIRFRRSQVVIDTFIYWFACDETMIWAVRKSYRSFNLIISFNIKSEKFEQISLPYLLAHHPDDDLPISKLKESLVVLEYDKEEDNRVYGIWMMMKMEDGVTNIFTKLYNINLPDGSRNTLLGFRINGQPIIDIRYSTPSLGKNGLYVYETNSKHIKHIKGIGDQRTTSVGWNFAGSYMETLLLLDH